jgi:hypothetical protein
MQLVGQDLWPKCGQLSRAWEVRRFIAEKAYFNSLWREASTEAADPEVAGVLSSDAGMLLRVTGAVALAGFSPKLAIWAGAVTLAAAAYWEKGWNWWIAGILVSVLGLFFPWNDQSAKERIIGLQK